MERGQLYVWVYVHPPVALERGSTKAGPMPVRITQEIVDRIEGPLRAVLGTYATTDSDKRPASHEVLDAQGFGADDVVGAIQAEAERRAEKAQKEAQEAAQEAAKLATLTEAARNAPIDDLLRDRGYYGDPRWEVHRDYTHGTTPIEAAGRLAEAKAEAERRNKEHVARQAADKAAKEQAKEQAKAARAAWIAEYGSPRLQRLLAEGIEHRAVYRDERLALERVGWRWDSKVLGDGEEPRNPPESALELLDQARATEPTARLVYWVVEACESEHYYHDEDRCPGYHEGWRGYAAVAEFLGRKIVYGGPEEE